MEISMQMSRKMPSQEKYQVKENVKKRERSSLHMSNGLSYIMVALLIVHLLTVQHHGNIIEDTNIDIE